jgi:hypothetical protein
MDVGTASTEGSAPSFEGEGFSILRDDESTAVLRGRLERPTRLGLTFFTLLGAVVASAGLLLAVTTGLLIDFGIAAFGGVLIALGVVQYFLLRRDREHWPDSAFLWERGVELVLHNGDVRALSWTDPDLAVNLVARPFRPPVNREFLLIWLRDTNVPTVEISAEGFRRVRQVAEDLRLNVVENRKGREPRTTQWIEIRPHQLGQISPAELDPAEATSS